MDFFLLEHNGPVNVDAMNTEYISRSQEVWDSIEADRWLYNLDNDEGILPDFNQPKINQLSCEFFFIYKQKILIL